MVAALAFLVGQLFLFGATSAQCPVDCSPCKVFPDGDYNGTWNIKAEMDPLCPDSCLYQRNSDEKEMCFCDPGPIEYDTCYDTASTTTTLPILQLPLPTIANTTTTTTLTTTVCNAGEINPVNCFCKYCGETYGQACTANQGCTTGGTCLDVCTPSPDSVPNDCFCESSNANNEGEPCSPSDRCYNGICDCPYNDIDPECSEFSDLFAKQSLCNIKIEPENYGPPYEEEETNNTIVELMVTQCKKTCFCGNFIDLEEEKCSILDRNWCYWIFWYKTDCDDLSCNDSGLWCYIWNNICKRIVEPFCKTQG